MPALLFICIAIEDKQVEEITPFLNPSCNRVSLCLLFNAVFQIEINKNEWEKFFFFREVIWDFCVNHFHF
jgi:hypothetical protein